MYQSSLCKENTHSTNIAPLSENPSPEPLCRAGPDKLQHYAERLGIWQCSLSMHTASAAHHTTLVIANVVRYSVIRTQARDKTRASASPISPLPPCTAPSSLISPILTGSSFWHSSLSPRPASPLLFHPLSMQPMPTYTCLGRCFHSRLYPQLLKHALSLLLPLLSSFCSQH